jgi:hypothetical protein
MDESTFLVTCNFPDDVQNIALEVVFGKGLDGMLGPHVRRDYQTKLKNALVEDGKNLTNTLGQLISSQKFTWARNCVSISFLEENQKTGEDEWFGHHSDMSVSTDK